MDNAYHQATQSVISDCELEVCSLQMLWSLLKIGCSIRIIYVTCDIRFVPLVQLCLSIALDCAYALEVN